MNRTRWCRSPRTSPHNPDPLTCRNCGGKLQLLAYVSDGVSIKRILEALGLSPPEEDRPPAVQEVVWVPVDEEGREVEVG